jgi:cytochrome o ubiquinol oxidase subunit 2
MKNKHQFGSIILLGLIFLGLFIFFLLNADASVLNPQGLLGIEQKRLLVISTWLILLVVAPVIILTFVFAWRYRESNSQARYEPEWEQNKVAEIIWWSIPLAVVICLSVLAWKGSHELDPYKPIVSDQKTLTIEVVALDWKWLFIYPEQGIATVNEVRFPEKTPILFKLTADEFLLDSSPRWPDLCHARDAQ